MEWVHPIPVPEWRHHHSSLLLWLRADEKIEQSIFTTKPQDVHLFICLLSPLFLLSSALLPYHVQICTVPLQPFQSRCIRVKLLPFVLFVWRWEGNTIQKKWSTVGTACITWGWIGSLLQQRNSSDHSVSTSDLKLMVGYIRAQEVLIIIRSALMLHVTRAGTNEDLGRQAWILVIYC